MANVKIPYADRKEAVREILLQRAREGRTITYGELGRLVDVPSRGPWKPLLDQLSLEERAKPEPDITYLVVKKGGLPGQIEFRPANPPRADQRTKAAQVIGEVFKRYKTD